MRFLTPLFIGLGLSLLATPVIRAAALRAGLLDAPGESRRVHAHPVPRLGGLAIAAGFYGALAAALGFGQLGASLTSHHAGRIVGLAVAGLVVTAAGAIDDVRGLRATTKLAVGLAVGCMLFVSGFRLAALPLPFVGEIWLGWLALPVTALWVAGVANAVNLLDGLDGLAGGVAVAGAVAAFAIGAHVCDPLMLVGALAMTGGILGFMAYNVKPASIFMGDSGSLFVGTILAALAIAPPQPSRSPCVIGMAVVLGVPIVDTLLAIARRVARGVPVFSPDREHVHHRLVEAGMSQRAAVLALWTVSALLSGVGVLVARSGGRHAGLAALVIASGVVALGQLGCIALPDRALVRRRRANRARLRSAEEVARRIERAASMSQVARELSGAARLLDVGAVRLRTRARSGAPPPVSAAPRGLLRRGALFAIDPRRPQRGAVEVLWADERGTLDRCTELAIERLCAGASVALSRLTREGAGAPPRAARPPAPGPRAMGPPAFPAARGDAEVRAPP